MQFSPAQIEDAFGRHEAAVQEMLLGSDYHPRYEGVGAVGLSVVFAADPDELGGPRVIVNNLADHLEAWTHEGVNYQKLIGRERGSGEARFDVFALAKIARLNANPELASSFDLSLEQPQVGQVGFAGGIRDTGSGILCAASGLWELHDDVVIRSILAELIGGVSKHPEDVLAAEFERITSLHVGVAADQLTRQELKTILEGKKVER